ncbi:MAG: thiamine ABC transporter substrate-binding protein [Trueperaceae bacterium]
MFPRLPPMFALLSGDGKGHKMFRSIVLTLSLLLLAVGHAQPLRVLTHDSFDLSSDVLDRFSQDTGVDVQILPAGDAGEVVSRAILTRARPIADVLFGVDNSLLTRALEANIFEPYRSPLLDKVPERFVFDPEHRVTPIDVGYVLFNIDVGWFEREGLAPPQDISELTAPRYRGLTVVADPATSSPGLAFLLTTVERFGDDGWLSYWADLRDNDLQVASGWSDAYYTAFTRYGGDRPIVLSYATSPAAEVMFAEEPLDSSPTANLLCRSCAYRQVEAAGILRGTQNLDAARLFIDFLLSEEVQADIPGVMFVYPVRQDVPLPREFELHADVPDEEQTAELAPGLIAEGLERWLDLWTQVVSQGRDPEQAR